MLSKEFLPLVIAATNANKKVIKIIILPQFWPLPLEVFEPPIEEMRSLPRYLPCRNQHYK